MKLRNSFLLFPYAFVVFLQLLLHDDAFLRVYLYHEVRHVTASDWVLIWLVILEAAK